MLYPVRGELNSGFLEREEREFGIVGCKEILFSLSQMEDTSLLSLLDALFKICQAPEGLLIPVSCPVAPTASLLTPAGRSCCYFCCMTGWC